MTTSRTLFILGAALAWLSSASCSARSTRASLSPVPAPDGNLDPRSPLTDAQHAWIETTLASLTLRERVGQMINAWVLGDYTNTRDSSFAEVLRWIRDDKVGGIAMSLGSPFFRMPWRSARRDESRIRTTSVGRSGARQRRSAS